MQPCLVAVVGITHTHTHTHTQRESWTSARSLSPMFAYCAQVRKYPHSFFDISLIPKAIWVTKHHHLVHVLGIARQDFQPTLQSSNAAGQLLGCSFESYHANPSLCFT
jgi:hypothetical protein